MNPFPVVVKFVSVNLVKAAPKSPADLAYLAKKIANLFTTFNTYPVLPYNNQSAEYNKGWLDGWKAYEETLKLMSEKDNLAASMAENIKKLTKENKKLQKELTSLKN